MACFIGILVLDRYEPFAYSRARNILRDTIARAGRTTPPNPDLVFLAIDSASASLEPEDIDELYGIAPDDASKEARALRLISAQWPWAREVHALVLERLVEAGAKAVMFDLTFPTATPGDEPFRRALETYSDKVVIGSNFVSAAAREYTTISASHMRPTESLVPHTAPMDPRVAYTNFWPDSDDVVRRAQYRVTFEQVQGTTPTTDSEQFLSLVSRGMEKAGYASLVPPGLGEHKFRFTAPPREGFRPRSLFEVFIPEYWQQNYNNGQFFRGKIVLIGAEGNWQHDEHPTPFGSMPGPELHLNALNAALHGEFIGEVTHRTTALVAALTGICAIVVSLLVTSPWLRLLVLIGGNGLILGAGLFAFNVFNLYISMLAPLIELNVTVLLGLASDLTWERFEKTRVRRTLEKYVSNNVVHQLLDRPGAFQQSLGGVLKPAAILFSDIRGYSTVSARTDPQALVSQLNEYLTAMVECVFRYGGTLDKFIGDAVMAVWGNVTSHGVRNDTANAVRAGLAMHAELARLNEGWRQRGLPELRVGIAVNQGDVIVGNIGSQQRMEFTVIGDAVNVTWKLQELTKDLGCGLIVCDNVTALLVEDFELQRVGDAMLPGHAAKNELFAVLGEVNVGAPAPRESLALAAVL
jgi:adenylate cyclase